MSGSAISESAARMKQHARREFDAWAATYDRSLLNYFLFEPSYLTLAEEISRWRAERNAEPVRVLDIGCGTGSFALLASTAPWKLDLVGLDYSAEMCQTAQTKNVAAHAEFGALADANTTGRTHFVNGDSEHLPFADASFDLVTCANSFHHYPAQQSAVREMHRVLAPGGRLILIDGFRDCVIGWFVFDVIIDHVEKSVHHAPWHVIHGYFEQAGFQAIRRRKFGLFFPALATIGDR